MAMTQSQESALAIVAEKGGKVLDRMDEKDIPGHHVWIECSGPKGPHQWRAQYGHLNAGHWCPKCYGNTKLTIEFMRELAAARGGKCVSAEYNGLKKPLTWECAYGHQWDAIPNNVKNHGSWCPHCKINVGEELTRAAIEEAFPGHKFYRTRREPWMEGLELDGYNPDLPLAFEYQGRQHYERVPHFQRNEGDFEAQQDRDYHTRERCEENNVGFIDVPFTVKFTDIRTYVRSQLEDLCYEIAPKVGSDSEFYDRIRAKGNKSDKQFEKAVSIITKKGGECISEQYIGYRVPMTIKCRFGHIFEATLEAIDQPEDRGPRFCPQCGGTSKKSDSELQKKVEACGYTYHSVESRHTSDGRSRRYINITCPNGHNAEVMWDNFCPTIGPNGVGVPKKGCAKCSAASRGASKRFNITEWSAATGINPITPYKTVTAYCDWRCAAGHEFTAKLNMIRDRKMHPCVTCGLLKYADGHDLTPTDAISPNAGPTDSIKFLCNVCNYNFTTTPMVISRTKDMPCPNCRKASKDVK